VSVAVEYLEARYRLYRMVYTHKTMRAAEKMLEALLQAVAARARTGKITVPDH
jgi:HD superfamily phosphohydrolase